ncbi:MAG: DegV family protein [Gemmatimonadetes bacterium]|nr:MAG: DegV family protein [Gemmatimonadota bacterium]
MRAIQDHLAACEARAVSEVAHEAAQAAVLGARGNCGMMLSHFLLGFACALEGVDRTDARGFGGALAAGVQRLDEAIERPVEGTILTVMRDTAAAAVHSATQDVAQLLEDLLDSARSSLARTPELLPALRAAGVVDAGAKGFVALLEGVVGLLRGDPVVALDGGWRASGTEGEGRTGATGDEDVLAAAAAEYPQDEERFRYCTEALVRGEGLPSQAALREALRPFGDSLIVIRSEGLAKIHVHTDEPEKVFAYLRTLGTLATHKAEDMQAQHDALARAGEGGHVSLARRPVGVLTDSAADLPEEVVRAHGIEVVPMVLVDGTSSLRDGVDITAEEFHARLSAEGPVPTTSQPPPAAFVEGMRRAAEQAEHVVAVVLGSSLSGTYASAEAARDYVKEAPVTLVDSLGASLLQGLLALRAAEMAEAGETPERIAAALARIRRRSGILFTVDTFERLIASGRVGRGRALLGAVLNVKPILGLTAEGHVEPVGKAVGRRRVMAALLDAIRERVPADAGRVRFGVVHVACPDIVDTVAAELRSRFGRDVEILSAPATPVISTHLGPGAWGVAYMVEGAGTDAEPAPAT